MEEFQGLPSVEDAFREQNYNLPITVSDIQHIVDQVSSKTFLDSKQSEKYVKAFFEVIRGSILSGDTVSIYRFGSFYISSPEISKNKKKVFVKFKPSKNLRKRMNEYKR
jgi:nucleoid DNA-binding protein